MPAATQRFFIEPSFQRVTRAVVRRAIEIIDSMQLVLVSVLARVPPMPRRRDGEHVVEPFAQAGGGVGMIGLELVGQCAWRRSRPLVGVGLGEDEGQALVDGAGQLLGQMAGHIAALVQGAALHHGLRRRRPS